MQLYDHNVKIFYKGRGKNNLSSKIWAATQAQSQKMTEKFMRKRKSKHEERLISPNDYARMFRII